MKKIYITFILLLLTILFSSCTLFRIIRYRDSEIDDYQLFPYRELEASKSPFQFKKMKNEISIPKKISYGETTNILLEELLTSTQSVAFLVLKGDTLLFEGYYNGYSDTSICYSFSTAKSFLSILVGCAIDDGYIKSVDQPVTDYVPELKENGFDKVKIEHLLQMTSGMDYPEPGWPLGLHSHFYYTENLEKHFLKLKLKDVPGTKHRYKSGENQLLGLVLSRALGDRTLTGYMQERIWNPTGMEHGGLWSVDHQGGIEKTFCCIGARARDFAKLGLLYLNNGNWNGKQILSEGWVRQSTKIDTSNGSSWHYQYQWWMASKEGNAYYASGHRGQYVYITPEKQVVIVRLGKRRTLKTKNWLEIFSQIAQEVRR